MKAVSIALGGALATAVAFGPARMGYGLFLPRFRDTFSLSTTGAGLIVSAAFAAFFCALLVSAYLVARHGPRTPVVGGSLAAAIGMALIAIAQSKAMLAGGTVLAATSAGLCWSPFNDAAGRAIASGLRDRALTVVSTGTTVGIAGAGACALAVAALDWHWRAVWFGFSALAVLCAVLNAYALHRLPVKSTSSFDHSTFERLAEKAVRPIYFIACSFGVTSGIYLSFAVDHVNAAGGLTGLQAGASGAVLFIAFGIGGTLGLLTADVEQRIGLRRLVQTLFPCSATSLLLVGIWPNTWVSVTGSAALQGLCLMSLSAIFSFVSQRLYPDLPTQSFTAVLATYAFGNAIGPILAGYVAGASSLAFAFTAAGVLSLVTSLVFRAGEATAAKG